MFSYLMDKSKSLCCTEVFVPGCKETLLKQKAVISRNQRKDVRVRPSRRLEPQPASFV